MYTDGKAHDLDWFTSMEGYAKQNVTSDTYANLASTGLYLKKDGLTVPDGAQSITFSYKKPDGTLIESDTVPVMYDGAKGDTGEKGDQGAYYLGTASGYAAFTDVSEGSWYLNTTDGYCYRYDNPDAEEEENRWTCLTDYSTYASYYNAAINDGLAALTESSKSSPLLAATNAWIKNLVAASAFIQNLFANHIELQDVSTDDPGYIAANYVSGSSGFKIDSTGEAEFNNIKIRGNSSFEGILSCGSLQVSERSYTAYRKTWSAGMAIFDAVTGSNTKGDTSYLVNNLTSGYINDVYSWDYEEYYLYNGTKYKYCQVEYYWDSSRGVLSYTRAYLALYNDSSDKIVLANYAVTPSLFTDITYDEGWPESNPTLEYDLYVVIEGPNTLMFQANDLPTYKPNESGIIYRSGNNLMIS